MRGFGGFHTITNQSLLLELCIDIYVLTGRLCTGARAAQVVPHVHFHIIPRIGDVPEVKARSWTVFGKGQREDLDEADAEILIAKMREALEKEVERVRRNEGEGAVRLLLNDELGTQRERSVL